MPSRPIRYPDQRVCRECFKPLPTLRPTSDLCEACQGGEMDLIERDDTTEPGGRRKDLWELFGLP